MGFLKEFSIPYYKGIFFGVVVGVFTMLISKDEIYKSTKNQYKSVGNFLVGEGIKNDESSQNRNC